MSSKFQNQSERFEGSVKWFSSRKGFGFITPLDESITELFVHQSEILAKGYRTLYEGDFVEFSMAEDPNGRLMAVEVVPRRRSHVQAEPGPCYTCGLFGHFARDCADSNMQIIHVNGDRNNGELEVQYVQRYDKCDNCGNTGHFARDCTKTKRIGGGNKGGENSRRNECYNCGKIGHYARDCAEESKRMKGGNIGGENSRRNEKCFACGKPGHFARDCRTVIKN